MSCVIDGLLYLCDCEDACNYTFVKKLNIRYIINATKDLPDYFCDLSHMHYLSVPIEDEHDNNVQFFFDQVFNFIERAKASSSAVLIHCHAGVSRSATLAIVYIMQSQNMGVKDACQFVRQARPTIKPNQSFMEQLTKYEKQLSLPVFRHNKDQQFAQKENSTKE